LFLKEHPCEVLDGTWVGWTPETVLKADLLGSRVWPDIQKRNEDPNYWEEVIAVGFSGVQTDHPKKLIEWLKVKKLR
jgi:glycerophosphoryl diester phosphodiesterase